ncbi:MAG: TIGR03986 family CRISPR-associated RAMP protein [Streptosporangiaceae bacterium]
MIVPGSSVKGAVRSLHETLMGGCLRVLDEEFVPVYREPAVAKPEGWWLGVVRESTRQGRALKVDVTTKTVWIPAESVRKATSRAPETGSTVDLADNLITYNDGLGRSETDSPGVRRGDAWVLLVGDSGTRGNAKKFYCAAGRLVEGGDLFDVTVDAWQEYEDLCSGTEDMRLYRQDPDNPRFEGWNSGRVLEPVRWRATTVGKRRRVTGRLWPGDVVWAQVDLETGTIDHLSMAAIWRIPGKRPGQAAGQALGDRVPSALHACTDWANLCLSCRLFGSADTTGGDRESESDQRSYAGHLRIGPASASGVTTGSIRLAPLGAPRPGAGQFYLKQQSTDPASAEDELPSAYWGSEHDAVTVRQVRGRKFYWHGDPSARKPPRHIARSAHRNERMSTNRDVVQAGTVFTQEIRFDNISRAELASLIITLEPGLLRPRTEGKGGAEYSLHLGGGKPLGLGSCAVKVVRLDCWDAAARYGGEPAVSHDPQALAVSMFGDVALMAGPSQRNWPVLSRILRTDGVRPTRIWYPLGGSWTDDSRRDQSFRFFTDTKGQYYARRKQPIVPLPDPAETGDDQTLTTP